MSISCMIMRVPGLIWTCTVGGKRYAVLSQGILDTIAALNLSGKRSERASGKIIHCYEDVDSPRRYKASNQAIFCSVRLYKWNIGASLISSQHEIKNDPLFT